MPSLAISPARSYGGRHHPQPQPAFAHRSRALRCTYLGGDGIFIAGASLRVLSLLSWSRCAAALFEASEAMVDKAGSCIEAWPPCRCWVNDATVELDDGRERLRPMISGLMDGSVSCSSAGGDVVLMAGRSNACSIDGLRNVSWACGRGRIEVASAEAVVDD